MKSLVSFAAVRVIKQGKHKAVQLPVGFAELGDVIRIVKPEFPFRLKDFHNWEIVGSPDFEFVVSSVRKSKQVYKYLRDSVGLSAGDKVLVFNKSKGV